MWRRLATFVGQWLLDRYLGAGRVDPIITAVYQAAADVGLNRDALKPDTDLVSTGKLYEVLYHAAKALGKNHELRTVQDVIDWLREAPEV